MSAVANEVAAIEWNHRNQIGEAQEEVYPSQPEEEVEGCEHAFGAQSRSDCPVSGGEHRALLEIHRMTVESDRHAEHRQRCEDGPDDFLPWAEIVVEEISPIVHCGGTGLQPADPEESVSFLDFQLRQKFFESGFVAVFAFSAFVHMVVPSIGENHLDEPLLDLALAWWGEHGHCRRIACFEVRHHLCERGIIDYRNIVDLSNRFVGFQTCIFGTGVFDDADSMDAIVSRRKAGCCGRE